MCHRIIPGLINLVICTTRCGFGVIQAVFRLKPLFNFLVPQQRPCVSHIEPIEHPGRSRRITCLRSTVTETTRKEVGELNSPSFFAKCKYKQAIWVTHVTHIAFIHCYGLLISFSFEKKYLVYSVTSSIISLVAPDTVGTPELMVILYSVVPFMM